MKNWSYLALVSDLERSNNERYLCTSAIRDGDQDVIAVSQDSADFISFVQIFLSRTLQFHNCEIFHSIDTSLQYASRAISLKKGFHTERGSRWQISNQSIIPIEEKPFEMVTTFVICTLITKASKFSKKKNFVCGRLLLRWSIQLPNK